MGMDWWSAHRNGTPSGGVCSILLLFSHGKIGVFPDCRCFTLAASRAAVARVNSEGRL